MHTIQLKIKDDIYDKVITMLREFSSDEIQILENSSSFDENKHYLEQELDEIVTDNVTFLNQNEFEQRLSTIC